MKHTTTVSPKEASGPGALPGFAVTCDRCGHVGGSSLKVLAEEHARAHSRWMEANGRS